MSNFSVFYLLVNVYNRCVDGLGKSCTSECNSLCRCVCGMLCHCVCNMLCHCVCGMLCHVIILCHYVYHFMLLCVTEFHFCHYSYSCYTHNITCSISGGTAQFKLISSSIADLVQVTVFSQIVVLGVYFSMATFN